MASPTPHIRLMALLARAQASDQLHAKMAQDHSQRHEQEQEKKRVQRATATRAGANGNQAG